MGERELQMAIEASIREASARNHEYVTVEHMLYSLLFEEVASNAIVQCGGDLDELKEELEDFFDKHLPKVSQTMEPRQSLGFRRVLERAILQVQSSGRMELNGADILVAFFGEKDSYCVYLLQKQGLSRLDVINYISHGLPGTDEDASMGSSREEIEEETIHPQDQPSRRPLEKFTFDLTQLAREGKLDPLIGREAELTRIMQVLCRRTKNNPVLIGDAGVGKTAIVEGLAQKIVNNDVPEILQGSEIFGLDLGSLLAGTKFRGQFEERLKGSLDALKKKEK